MGRLSVKSGSERCRKIIIIKEFCPHFFSNTFIFKKGQIIKLTRSPGLKRGSLGLLIHSLLNCLHKPTFWEYSSLFLLRLLHLGNSLAVQWLGLHAFTVVGPDSIPGWGEQDPARSCGVAKKIIHIFFNCYLFDSLPNPCFSFSLPLLREYNSIS